jgi:hypothetical protein
MDEPAEPPLDLAPPEPVDEPAEPPLDLAPPEPMDAPPELAPPELAPGDVDPPMVVPPDPGEGPFSSGEPPQAKRARQAIEVAHSERRERAVCMEEAAGEGYA